MRRSRIEWSNQERGWPHPEDALSKWLKELAKTHRKRIKRLAFNLLSDEELLEINKRYLDHDTYTDIITFDYSGEDGLVGEVYISSERIEENALKNQTDNNIEMMRVIAHGLLHLCGYKDKQDSEKLKMRKAEEDALKLWLEVSRGT